MILFITNFSKYSTVLIYKSWDLVNLICEFHNESQPNDKLKKQS